ncbi:MAG: ATP-binding protein [Pseudomonadota bacterium]
MNALPSETQLWNALPNPALIVEPDWSITAVNAAGEAFLATSERQLQGQSIIRLVGQTSRTAALIEQSSTRAMSMADYEVELTLPDQPTRLVDLHCTPLPDETGAARTGRLMLVIHPRAIAESMDRSLSHRDAARSVTGLAAMLAHEVKNPLAGISGAAQLLQMTLGDRERELTELIRAETDRISTLLTRVEAFGMQGSTRSEPVNIHDVLDRSVKSAKAGFARHVRFIEEYDPSLPPVMGDADQLIQVFINLLKNAAEATPEVGGLITVRTAYRSGVKVMTATGRRASLPLQVTISDNGRGVPEGLIDHLFEPFVTSKTTGTGLGLAYVSKIVAEHGGVISCESEPGWTRMRLRLPIASANDVAAAERARAEAEAKAAGEIAVTEPAAAHAAGPVGERG